LRCQQVTQTIGEIFNSAQVVQPVVVSNLEAVPVTQIASENFEGAQVPELTAILNSDIITTADENSNAGQVLESGQITNMEISNKSVIYF
jgi:hypothetical protein